MQRQAPALLLTGIILNTLQPRGCDEVHDEPPHMADTCLPHGMTPLASHPARELTVAPGSTVMDGQMGR